MSTLYFDIDGVLLNYEEQPKPALTNGRLEETIKATSLERLICVSGWANPTLSFGGWRPDEQKILICTLLKEIFPDRVWFLERLELIENPDNRCAFIDFSTDWHYMDDWADTWFSKAHGQTAYEKELGKRILLVDPYADGSDVIQWLKGITLGS
jgi:hypothetical protein